MYIVYSEIRNAYKTYDGWTTITRTPKGITLDGLNDVIHFTKGEAERNADKLPKGSRFVHFPKVEWSDFDAKTNKV